MKKATAITCVFLDIGGVLLTNAWEHQSRRLAAKVFNLDPDDMDARHQLTSDTYMTGKLSLEERGRHHQAFRHDGAERRC